MPGFLDRLFNRPPPLNEAQQLKQRLGYPTGPLGGTPLSLEYPRNGEVTIAAGADVTFTDAGPFTARLIGVNVQSGIEVDVYFDEVLFFHSEGNELGDYQKVGRAAHAIRVRIQNPTSDDRIARVLLSGEIL